MKSEEVKQVLMELHKAVLGEYRGGLATGR